MAILDCYVKTFSINESYQVFFFLIIIPNLIYFVHKFIKIKTIPKYNHKNTIINDSTL